MAISLLLLLLLRLCLCLVAVRLILRSRPSIGISIGQYIERCIPEMPR